MLDVKTPLSKVQRTSRRLNQKTSFFVPGNWGYVSGGLLNAFVTGITAAQPVMKLVMGNNTSNVYESNDVEVGSISTVEGVFRAAVDSNGYQVMNASTTPAAITYNPGDDLTVAWATTATGTTSLVYAAAADLGKLHPATTGDVVVARVESVDSTNSVLTFETVTPHVK